jgi:ATP-dependent DNA helicase RecG
MSLTSKDIDALLGLPSETEHLEFKEAKKNFHFEELVEYCCALANEGGGRIFLGISDRPPRRVVGTEVFPEPARTVSGIYDRLKVKVLSEDISHPAGRVLMFEVAGRPKGQPLEYRGKYLMRAGESLVPMSPDMLRSIFSETQDPWELRPARTDCSGEMVIELLSTPSYFGLIGIPYPENRDAVLERLQKERLVQLEESGGWTITNLGAILFAKQLSQFDHLAFKAARVVHYTGTNKLVTKSDRPGERGYAVGFQGLVKYIAEHTAVNEVIEQALRKEVKMFPESAVRELVANAMVHQDFNETGMSLMVEIYSDRIEVSNPGGPAVDPDRFIDDFRSRNEILAGLARRLKMCEEKGSGIDRVVAEAEVYQLPAPEFRDSGRRTQAILYAHQDFDAMSRTDRMRACYQHCCLKYVTHQRMTNRTLRERFKLSEEKSAIVSDIINSAMEVGLIKLADPDQKAYQKRSYLPYWA